MSSLLVKIIKQRSTIFRKSHLVDFFDGVGGVVDSVIDILKSDFLFLLFSASLLGVSCCLLGSSRTLSCLSSGFSSGSLGLYGVEYNARSIADCSHAMGYIPIGTGDIALLIVRHISKCTIVALGGAAPVG